jgi:DNA-binding PadR family transcriptional regulator
MYRECSSWWAAQNWAPLGAAFFPWIGGRWGRWSRFFGPGEVRLALLSLLEQGPKHGYELMKDLEARSGGIYRASAGAIYPALQQLEDEGLVTSEQSDGKRTYRLTEAGKQELAREAEAVRRIWQRAQQWEGWGPWIGPEAAEVARPAAELLKAALRAATRGSHDSARIARIREILERARTELEGLDKPPQSS